MDFSRAFNYPRNDPGWLTKLLIMGVVTCVPIVNFAAFGYMLEGIRRVSRGDESTLPEWDNFGGYFMDGARVFVTMLVYMLPIFLVLALSIGAAVAAGDDAGGIAVLFANLFQMFWQFLFWIVYPAMLIRLAFSPGWGAGFDFGGIMSTITRNVGSYVMVLLGTILFGIVGGLGVIACFVGILLTAPYAQMSIAHLFAQLARETDNSALYS